MVNVLTDVPFIPVVHGSSQQSSSKVTVLEALRNSKQYQLKLEGFSGYQLSGLMRFLTQTLAFSLAHAIAQEEAFDKKDLLLRKYLREGLPPAQLEAAFSQLAPACQLEDLKQPFMQRPRLEPSGPKDKTRLLEPGNMPVKKLSPAMPGDRAEEFWQMNHAVPTSLPIEQALIDLIAYHFFASAGNNSYDTDKCRGGAPGLRFPGVGHTATEFFWWNEENLWETLLVNIDKQVVRDGGYPAWADRTAEKSWVNKGGKKILPRLWTQSFSPNTAVGLFSPDDHSLIGVRIGGVPASWVPFVAPPAGDKADEKRWSEELKAWTDHRYTEDPYYLRVTRKDGRHEFFRLDIGASMTQLMVNWVVEGYAEQLLAKANDRLGDTANAKVMILRHFVAGTVTSSSIRASEILIEDRDRWVPEESVAQVIAHYGSFLQSLEDILVGVFCRSNSGDANRRGGAYILDAQKSLRRAMRDEFWLAMEPLFERVLQRDKQSSGQQLIDNIAAETIAAFHRVCRLAGGQNEAQMRYVEAYVELKVSDSVNKFKGGF